MDGGKKERFFGADRMEIIAHVIGEEMDYLFITYQTCVLLIKMIVVPFSARCVQDEFSWSNKIL